jgi:hypothetical protein
MAAGLKCCFFTGNSGGIKSRLQPLRPGRFYGHDVKARRRQATPTQKVVLRRKNNAPLFHKSNAGSGPSVVGPTAPAHFDKHHGTVCGLHDQVNFATPSAGRPIIALQQAQTARLQIGQRLVFARITSGFGGLVHCVFFEELH